MWRSLIRERKNLPMLSDAAVKELLQRANTIAVVGLSDSPDRPSYMIAQFLQQQGYRIIPVNPNLSGTVLGEQPYARLSEIAEPIDIVNVFRRSNHLAGVVEEAMACGAGALWAQPGVYDPVAEARAQAAGLPIVTNRCIAVEYRRHGVRR
jgi:predicted CoA-binding protein